MTKIKKQINNINIIGGSAFGVLLALALRQDKSLDSKTIKIFERSNRILSSWNHHNFPENIVNRGFFGIEIPRGQDFISILGENFISKNFKSIPNFKLLIINKKILPYQYEIDDLPEIYRNQIISYQNKSIKNNDNIFSQEFSNFSFFKTLKVCSQRYSDVPNDSEYLFYPWFFPKSSFNSIENISEQTNEEIQSHYLIPKNGIFSTVVNDIEELLKKRNIKLEKNISIDLNNIKKSDKEIYIWASSSIGIMKHYKPEALKNLKLNKRYLGLCLFRLNKEKLDLWKRSFKYQPSEVITINIELPGVSRISFSDHLNNKEFGFLLIEINSKNKNFVNADEIERIEDWLSEIFFSKVEFVDSSLLCELYNPPLNSYEIIEKELNKIRKNISLEIPFSYWWPINTSRAVNAAIKYRDNFKRYIY